MAMMTHRTTFALDQETAFRLKRLAALWNVSQAEVVRRSVEQAESSSDPVLLLDRIHKQGMGLPDEVAAEYLRDVYQDRGHWRGQ
jgi:hypothetical protein